MATWLRKSRTIFYNYLYTTRTINTAAISLYGDYSTTSVANLWPTPPLAKSPAGTLLISRRQHVQSQVREVDEDEIDQGLEYFPAGKIPYTSEMSFIAEFTDENRVHCFRVIDDHNHAVSSSSLQQVSKEVAVKMYSSMVTFEMMDNIFYEAQRQGRLSFYLTSKGEEAINIASAAALGPDDVVLAQYREHCVLLWRGFSLQEFANQCFGNSADYGKGRQMPIHYGSNKLNYFTISSPLA